MSKTVVSSKYQIVIPKNVREAIGLKIGTTLEIITYGNRIELIPVGPITNLKGFVKGLNTDVVREDDRV